MEQYFLDLRAIVTASATVLQSKGTLIIKDSGTVNVETHV